MSPNNPSLPYRGYELLKELRGKIANHEKKLKEAINDFLSGGAAEIIIDGKVLSQKELALNFKLLHFQAAKIETFNGTTLHPHYYRIVRDSLKIVLDIVSELEIEHDEPEDIIQWLND